MVEGSCLESEGSCLDHLPFLSSLPWDGPAPLFPSPPPTEFLQVLVEMEGTDRRRLFLRLPGRPPPFIGNSGPILKGRSPPSALRAISEFGKLGATIAVCAGANLSYTPPPGVFSSQGVEFIPALES